MKATGKPKAIVLELALLQSPSYLIDTIHAVYRKAVEDGTTYQAAAANIRTQRALEAAERLMLFDKHYNCLSSDELYVELYVLPAVECGERPLFQDEENLH